MAISAKNRAKDSIEDLKSDLKYFQRMEYSIKKIPVKIKTKTFSAFIFDIWSELQNLRECRTHILEDVWMKSLTSKTGIQNF